jgi:hypothetical protein
MFHAAWPASVRPAFRPTRGSGLGARVDALEIGVGLTDADDVVDDEQAANPSSPSRSVVEERAVALRLPTPGRTVD